MTIRFIAMSSSSTPDAIVPEPEASTATYSERFPLHDRADLLVRSSDGTLFATQKFHLQAASPVFEDLLQKTSELQKEEGRPVLSLEESAADLELLWPFLHRSWPAVTYEKNAAGILQLMKDTLQVSSLIEKYAMSKSIFGSVVHTVADKALELARNPDDYPEEEFDKEGYVTLVFFCLLLGMIHESAFVSALGLTIIFEEELEGKGQSVLTHRNEKNPEERSTDWRYLGVKDIPEVFLHRLSRAQIQLIATIMSKRSNKVGYSEDDALAELIASFKQTVKTE